MLHWLGLILYELVGKRYHVRYRVVRGSDTRSSRGDHGMGGGEYQVAYWSGYVTVRDRETNKCLAACQCGVGEDRSFNRSDEEIRKLIEVDDVLPDRAEDYADYMGEEIIKFFQEDTSEGMPYQDLKPVSRVALINRGFVLDVNGQRSLALS